jgi:hypothetical protein
MAGYTISLVILHLCVVLMSLILEESVTIGLIDTQKQMAPYNTCPVDQISRAVQVGAQQPTYHMALGTAILYMHSNPLNRSLFTELQLCAIFMGCWKDKAGSVPLKSLNITMPLIHQIYMDTIDQCGCLFHAVK